MKCFYLSLFAGFALTISAQAEVYETQVEQSSGEDGAYAQFKLWIPPGSHPDRLIALTWGSNQCSLDVANDPGWQNLARETGAGLLTCFFVPQASHNHWDHAAGGSGQALLDALSTLAKLSRETQLANARLYLVGDSQGGQFSFSFAGWKPDRVLGFVSLKGGRHEASDIETAARVPGLFFVGESDVPYRVANIEQTFIQGRARGALWCLAIDKQGKHEPGPCAPLLRAFLEEISGYQKAVIPASLRGDRRSDKNPSALSWFPSSRFKNNWVTFESGKLVSNPPNLSFESKMPAVDWTTVPDSFDIGTIESGDKSQLVTLHASPGASPHWDRVTILNQPYLSDAAAVIRASGSLSVSFKLNTDGLPLGRFSGVVPLRFAYQGKPILGGLNLPLTAKVVGDLSANPSFIYLEPARSGKVTAVKIEIHSKLNETIKLLSCEVPRGVSLISESKSGSPLALTVSFNHEDEDSATIAEGAIWLHLETTKKWTLRIPYMYSQVAP